jgi:hypothetical protein
MFTIFLENRVGRLGQLVRTLEESLSKVVALSIEESADNALVRLICSEPTSSQVLREAGFSFSESELLGGRAPPSDQTPPPCDLLRPLAAEINIHTSTRCWSARAARRSRSTSKTRRWRHNCSFARVYADWGERFAVGEFRVQSSEVGSEFSGQRSANAASDEFL